MGKAQQAPLITSPFPKVGEMPITWGEGKHARAADGYKAIVDLDTGKLFSIVSANYTLIRHEDAIIEVEQAISCTKDLGRYEAITEFSNGGGRMRRTYRFTEIAVEVKEGDLVNPELHLFNSYDTKWPFIIILGAFRVICTNGLIVGEKFLHLRRRHIYEFGQINVSDEVGTALERFDQQAQEWKGWTERRLTPGVYDKVLEIMRFGIKAREAVEKRVLQEAEDFDSDGFPVITAWGFYNVLTWFISHNAVSLNHRVQMEDRLRSATFHLTR